MVKRIGMRRLAAFAAAAALVLGLVGCGGAQSTAQGNTEPVNLSVWTYYNGDQLESFNKLVEPSTIPSARKRTLPWRATARAASTTSRRR